MDFLVCLVFCLPDVAAAVFGGQRVTAVLSRCLCVTCWQQLFVAGRKCQLGCCGDPAPRISLVVMGRVFGSVHDADAVEQKFSHFEGRGLRGQWPPCTGVAVGFRVFVEQLTVRAE